MATYHRGPVASGQARYVRASARGACASCNASLRPMGAALGDEATWYDPRSARRANRLCGTCAADELHGSRVKLRTADGVREVRNPGIRADWKRAVAGAVYAEPSDHSAEVRRAEASAWAARLCAPRVGKASRAGGRNGGSSKELRAGRPVSETSGGRGLMAEAIAARTQRDRLANEGARKAAK